MKKSGLFLLLFSLTSTIYQSALHAQTLQEYAQIINSRSWGLKNTGSQQKIDLDPLQTYFMQARVGEDIHFVPSTLPLRKNIKVAILDTGIDINHPYLKDHIFKKKSECAVLEKFHQCTLQSDKSKQDCAEEFLNNNNVEVDQDHNSYPGDCAGWSIEDFTVPGNILGNPDFSDVVGHGTHVAGIVATVAPMAQLIPVQVITQAPNQPTRPFSVDLSANEDNRGGFGSDPQLAEIIGRGLIYAIESGADVINLSLGWPRMFDTELIKEAIAEAQRRGIIIIAAAGNDSTNELLSPCQYKGVICVAATKPDGSMARFSNYGFGVDIAAPGASIVSTIPEKFHSVNIPAFNGVDYLSGTSQATPFVTGVVADLLARGVSANEIYARLMLGSRPLQDEMPLIVGPLAGDKKAVTVQQNSIKFVLSGQLDHARSLNVKPQAYIAPADKEIVPIHWDRKSSRLKANLKLKNYWVKLNQAYSVKIKWAQESLYNPDIISVGNSSATSWDSGEEKQLDVTLQVKDQKDPSLSQLSSDLLFDVQIEVNGKTQFRFYYRAEVLADLDLKQDYSDFTAIPLQGQLDRGMKFYLINEVYDGHPENRDYFTLAQDADAVAIQLVRYQNKKYVFSDKKNIPFDGKISRTLPKQFIRIDIDFDGIPEYVLGIQEYLDSVDFTGRADYIQHFLIFDQNLNLKKKIKYYDKRAPFSQQFQWLKVGTELKPAWITQGYSVPKVVDAIDLWSITENDGSNLLSQKSQDIRFYYLNQNDQLAELKPVQGTRIVDYIDVPADRVATGQVMVLMAQNKGSENRPSYVYDFSTAWVINEKLVQQKMLITDRSQQYRNLIDTFKDKTLGLNVDDDAYRGTFWFGLDTNRRQRVTLIDFKNGRLTDQILNSQVQYYDAPLRVRYAFSGDQKTGAFVITNTEIEYHDFKTGTVAQSSLNKFTFLGNDLIADLRLPITVNDHKSGQKLPALYTSAASGLNRGIKMLVPIFALDGAVQQLVSPARLNFVTPVGCRALSSPVYLGRAGYALDFYCGDKILRGLLNL